MKKLFRLLTRVLLLLALLSDINAGKAQSDVPIGPRTPGGIFDTLYDHLGQKYTLTDLDIRSTKPIGGTTTVHAVPTQTCQGGYFTCYFAPGSIFTNSTSAQTVLCQVLSDISTLINSNCPAGAIKIYCSNTPPGGTARAAAIPFMSMPLGPLTPNQGILDNQIYKYLISGQDPYASIPLIFNSTGFYYHGEIQMNPTNVWNFNMSITNIASNENDAYTLLLHEVIHSLGFYTMMTSSGSSIYFPANNYYSRYDQFLYDYTGSKLLTSTTPTTCPCNNLSFAPNPTVISTAVTGCINDVTTCSTAAQYSSSTVLTKVYTPNCFSPVSSLSHFEDMCPFSATVDLGCATSTNSALNNNLYYVMSNASSTGSCYVKRHPKEEEKNVLCDLGYSVNPIYNSTVAGGSYTYAGGCHGANIWGINDGYVNGAYTFTVLGWPSNTLAINIATDVIINDSPNTSTISCLDLIMGGITWTVTGGNIVITPTIGFSGPVIFRYMPQTTGSSSLITSFGGPTYILIYVVNTGDCAASSCDIINNGGFESFDSNGTTGCGSYNSPSDGLAACWMTHTQSPDVYRRNCVNLDLSASFPGNSHNGSPNDAIVGMACKSWVEERIQNFLSTPLIPSQVYNINFMAYNNAINGFHGPIVIKAYSCPSYIAGMSYSLLATFTLSTDNAWTACSATFTFNAGLNHNSIIIGGDYWASSALGGDPAYFYIDDVSVLPAGSPTFMIPTGNICGNTTFTDLAQYASAVPGTFTGSFVTSYTTVSGTIYDFNASGTAPAGVYQVAFNYTLSACPKTIWQTIVVAPQPTLTITPSIYCVNSATPAVFTASLSCSSCTSTIPYLWTPGNLVGSTQTLNPASSTIYTISATNGTCVITRTAAIMVATTTLNLVSSSSSICLNSSPVQLSASGNFSTVSWQPGSLTTTIISVSPSISTTYTASTTYSNGCTETKTIQIVATQSNCCQGNIMPSFNSSTISTTTFTSPLLFQNSFTVQPSQTLTLRGSEFTFDQNVKLTVANGAYLNIEGAHLYACQNDMWQGIEVLDGGKVITQSYSSKDNLIEDALVAMNVANHTPTVSGNILSLSDITFNKNHTSINLSNYQISSTVSAVPINLNNVVFTCRNFTFNSTTWPSASTSDLRSAGNPTTGLDSPYLLRSSSVATLKSPHSTQPSHIAINIYSVGVTTTLAINCMSLGAVNATAFTLFDSHGVFIKTEASNLKTFNNVFQNTRNYTLPAGGTYKGWAITHEYPGPGLMNTKLDLQGSSLSTGNRFWNCHIGISMNRPYEFDINNALFRSVQSTASTTGIQPGNRAIEVVTNRFDYTIHENEFTNINEPIYVIVAGGAFVTASTGTVNNGTYARRLRIYDNIFSAGSPTNAYMREAIHITGQGIGVWLSPTTTSVFPTVGAILIGTNTLTNVFQGINITNVFGFPVLIMDNTITLKEATTFSLPYQQAITLANSLPTSTYNVGTHVVSGNTASYVATPSTITSDQTGLIYCDLAGPGIASPSITCNDVTQGYQGFVFSGPNTGAVWAGNQMSLALSHGLVLANSGVIGAQGGTTAVSNNNWVGTWSGGSYGTYLINNSNASLSKLTVRHATISPTGFPPNNNGSVANFFWYGIAPNSIQSLTTGVGDYACSGLPNARVVSVPNATAYSTEEMFYIANTALYRFLHYNDSIVSANGTMASFYGSKGATSIGDFMAVEELLRNDNPDGAEALLNSIDDSDFNAVEANYKTFYTLYINYVNTGIDASYSEEDSLSLRELAELCPGTDGACVYQASGLFDLIYSTRLYQNCGGAARPAVSSIENLNSSEMDEIIIYPNPAQNLLNITSKLENEPLQIYISDLTGRIVLQKRVQSKGFIANLDMNLLNGAYIATVINSKGEKTTKKLLIAK